MLFLHLYNLLNKIRDIRVKYLGLALSKLSNIINLEIYFLNNYINKYKKCKFYIYKFKFDK